MLDPLAQQWILATNLGSGQQRQKHPRLLDHLPPTSTSNSGYMRSFRRRADCNTTPSCCAARHQCAVSVESTHQCGVNCKMSATVEREAVHDDFEPPAVHNVRLTKIQVAHEDVRGHPATSFAACSRDHILQGPSTLAQHPGLCARCTVMAKLIEWEATSAGTHGQVKRET